MMKKSTALLTAGACMAAGAVLAGMQYQLTMPQCSVRSPEIQHPFRIALITDLHSCRYGENQKKLILALETANPDLVLMGGDLFDYRLPEEHTMQFLLQAAERYPCYAVTGNHEYSGPDVAHYLEMMQKAGVTLLQNTCRKIEICGQTVNLCGVSDKREIRNPDYREEEYLNLVRHVCDQADPEHFTILLAHRPEYFQQYAQTPADLVLSGHAHGGQWRVPGLINGVYAPGQGMFPRYAGGEYAENDTTMIVSRGLAKEIVWIPRLYNPPEIPIINIM